MPPCYNTKHQSPPSGWPDATDRSITWLWSDGDKWLQVDVFEPGRITDFGDISIFEAHDLEGVCYRA